MNTIQRKLPKANLYIGAVRKFADGLDTQANSGVPSIAPQSIQDQRTETISLSEQLLDEWNHRLKNDLQILVRLLESGYRKARSSPPSIFLKSGSTTQPSPRRAQDMLSQIDHNSSRPRDLADLDRRKT